MISSRDISHSQFGMQNQMLVSCEYRDTANFRPWTHTVVLTYLGPSYTILDLHWSIGHQILQFQGSLSLKIMII